MTSADKKGLLNQLADSMERSGISWAFLREPEVVNDSRETEVDIWCASHDESDCLEVLIDSGWLVLGGRRVRASDGKWSSTAVRFFHRRSSQYVVELWVGDLRAGAVVYLDEQVIETSVIKIDQNRYVAGAALLFILFNRPLIRGNLHRYLNRARKSYESMNDKEKQLWRTNTAKNISVESVEDLEKILVSEPSEADLKRWRFIILTGHYRAGKFTFGQVLKLSISRVKRWVTLIGPRGTTVCFVGTDGSGKSSLASSLVNETKKSNETSVICYFGRSRGNSKVIELLRGVVLVILRSINRSGTARSSDQGFTASALDSPDHASEDQSGYSLVARNLASVAYLLDYWWRYLVQVKWKNRFSSFIFFDRGPMDIALIDGLIKGGALLLKLAPRFDYYVNCYAAPQVILSRKKERSAGEIERQQDILKLAMKANEGKRKGVSINTEGDMEKMVDVLNALIHLVSAYGDKKLDKEIYNYMHEIITRKLTQNEMA